MTETESTRIKGANWQPMKPYPPTPEHPLQTAYRQQRQDHRDAIKESKK